jgi:hypothetical protein
MSTILLIVLVLLLLGAFPRWPHSRNWGYGPIRRAGTSVGDRSDHGSGGACARLEQAVKSRLRCRRVISARGYRID